jgi:hypothetical protein
MELSRTSRNLWSHIEFLKLWIGQTISGFGSAITTLALPLTAVVILHATAEQMGGVESRADASCSLDEPIIWGMDRSHAPSPRIDHC